MPRSRPITSLLTALLAVLLLGHAVFAIPGPAARSVSARALLDRAPLVADAEAALAVEIDVPVGLHIQSDKPLDEFLVAAQVKVTPLDGLTFEAPKFPVAKEIPSPPGASSNPKMSIYDGRLYVLVPFKINATAAPGPRKIELSVTTQACDENSCFPPRTQKISLPVTIAAASTTTQPANADLFTAARAQTFPAAATSRSATLPANYQPAAGAENFLPLWQLLLFALLGGALLNIMPCVLPVIPLKVMSLVQQAHGNRRDALLHALVFSAGIIVLFVALGLALSLYATINHSSVVYGKQFQSPLFLLVMSAIVVALGLSMLGVWTINPPSALYNLDQPRTGYAGSFMSGLLATLLATPCSAPFLGPVLAWAFTQPLAISTAVLALVGVGMAVPYIILAAFPAGLDKIPRTGRWSELIKQFFGLVMIGVGLYLIMTIPDTGRWPFALAAMLVVAIVCWAWGQIPALNMATSRVWTIRIVAVVLGAAAIFGLDHFLAAPVQREPFTPAALQSALAEGRPVVIDWTATWCINCRFVEATVLDSDPVQKSFRDKKVFFLRADISTSNPPAEELLEKLGGRSIPFLAIFSPKRPSEPVILRDLYTRDRILRELEAAAK